VGNTATVGHKIERKNLPWTFFVVKECRLHPIFKVGNPCLAAHSPVSVIVVLRVGESRPDSTSRKLSRLNDIGFVHGLAQSVHSDFSERRIRWEAQENCEQTIGMACTLCCFACIGYDHRRTVHLRWPRVPEAHCRIVHRHAPINTPKGRCALNAPLVQLRNPTLLS
jgi:hypothetical protein